MDNQKGNSKDKSELMGELQIYQLELEMQNEELSVSYEMLENERSKFAGFFDLAPVGYFVLDHAGMVEEANQTATKLFGASRNMLLTKGFKTFIDAEFWDTFYIFLQRMQSTSEKESCEIKVTNTAKEVLYLRMEGRAVINRFSGKLQYYVTTIDITSAILAQKRLMNTTQRLEMTLRASGTGTWTMEMESKLLSLDDFCYSIIELNPWDFNGSINSFVALIHPDDQLAVRAALRKAASNFELLDFEFRVLTKKGGIKYLAAKGHQVSQVGGAFFAGIMMDVTEKKRLAKEALDLQNEKQRLVLSATFNAQEKERFRISNALHDSVCQILYGIRLNLQGIQLSSDKKKELNNASQLLDEAIRETRTISYELTPSVLRDFGFTAGVKEMAQRLSSSELRIFSHVDLTVDALDKEVQLYVFRMIQELTNNCLKHAQASEARITVTTEGDNVLLTVVDNGVGFKDSSDQALLKGSGLRAIKNRMFLLGGSMEMEASSKGTLVRLIFRSNQTPVVSA